MDFKASDFNFKGYSTSSLPLASHAWSTLMRHDTPVYDYGTKPISRKDVLSGFISGADYNNDVGFSLEAIELTCTGEKLVAEQGPP